MYLSIRSFVAAELVLTLGPRSLAASRHSRSDDVLLCCAAWSVVVGVSSSELWDGLGLELGKIGEISLR